MIGEQALLAEVGDPLGSDTTYLCAADADGMMVSFIQSTFNAFGSHIVVPGTGFPLQNRGSGFSLVEGHANLLAPRKRPFHTLIPGFLTHAGQAVGPFGVMGGHMQPQGHVQMIVNTLDYAMDPQSSLGAPRWRWEQERSIKLEPGAASLAEELARRGHAVEVDAEVDWAGRGQIIWRLSDETGEATSRAASRAPTVRRQATRESDEDACGLGKTSPPTPLPQGEGRQGPARWRSLLISNCAGQLYNEHMARHMYLHPHLPSDDLERRYRAAKEPHERSWWQILWLLSRGQTADGHRREYRLLALLDRADCQALQCAGAGGHAESAAHDLAA